MRPIDRINTSVSYQGSTIQIKPSAGGVWEIFLSSTVRDLGEYRREVKDSLAMVEMACFLSEEGWLGGYDATVQKCQDKLNAANGYMGVFAYWYGSVPPESDKSITHLEFCWAMQRWGENPRPPLAVFMPKLGSKAEKDLRKKASCLMSGDLEAQQQHATRLKMFHDEVLNWRIVKYFTDRYHLGKQAIATGCSWQWKPLDAARGAIEVIDSHANTRKVTDWELGLLGRTSHLDATESVLSEVMGRGDVPAVALFVCGDEEAGQKAFAQSMLSMKQFRRGRSAKVGRPPAEQYDLRMLMQWVGMMLGVLRAGEVVEAPAQLADLVDAELRKQQLCLVLDQVHRLAGGVVAFRRLFWQPFYERLKALWSQKPAGHRLLMVVVDYTGQSALWGEDVRALDWDASELDFSKLLLLPLLTTFRDRDVLRWLEDRDILDDPPGRRAELVRIALRNALGQPDGTPLHVFERLRGEILWPDGAIL